MTNPERPNIRVADDETSRERHTRIDAKLEALEDRLEKLEHWRTFQLGLLSCFTFCTAFISYLLTKYVFK